MCRKIADALLCFVRQQQRHVGNNPKHNTYVLIAQLSALYFGGRRGECLDVGLWSLYINLLLRSTFFFSFLPIFLLHILIVVGVVCPSLLYLSVARYTDVTRFLTHFKRTPDCLPSHLSLSTEDEYKKKLRIDSEISFYTQKEIWIRLMYVCWHVDTLPNEKR